MICVCGGSPLILAWGVFWFIPVVWFLIVGENTQVGVWIINTLVLPSLNRYMWGSVFFVLFSCRGDSQGEVEYVLSFSPLWFFILLLSYYVVISCRGEYTGRSNNSNSRSPTMNRNTQFWRLCILTIFGVCHLSGPLVMGINIIGVADPYIVYI